MHHLPSAVGSTVRTAALIGLVAFGLTACGGGNANQGSATSSAAATSASATAPSSASSSSPSSGASSSSGDSSQAATQIKQNWTTFFAAGTSADQKAQLLQNGQQFLPYIQQMAQSPLAKGVSAQVTNVTVNGQTATVTYTILLAGQPALKDQTGQAVLDNGTWKVGDASFCALLALQGSTPSVCPAASGSSSSAAASTTP